MNDLVMDIDSDDSFAGTQVVTQEIDSSRDTQLWWCDDVMGVIRSRANEDLCLEVEGGLQKISIPLLTHLPLHKMAAI